MLPLTISAQDGLISQYDYFDKKIASINLTTYYILKNGEFAYNKSYSNGYPYGAIKRLDSFEEGALSSLYICFCVSNIDSNYLCYYFDSNKWNYEVKIISGEGARNHGLLNLTPSDFFNIRIFKPHTLEEQCKISNFLELIYAKEKIINRKINILKKYKEGIKKYVMKDTIKFWKTGIGNAIELKNYLFEKNEYGVKNGLYPHITLSTEGITDKSERYDRDFLVKNEDKKYKITHLNQLCYNPANLKFGVICINKYGDGIFSPIYSTFDINNIVIDYLELIITSNDFINYSMKYQQGTVFERMAVSSNDLCKIKIVTTSFDEQQRIAKVADTLNKKISKLEDELLNLKHLKSTLLNSMFI